MYASRVLGATALRLYLYLAANANDYRLALSPAAIKNNIGMPISTYRDQFDKLVMHGFLVPSSGNTYDFYELPQTRAVTIPNESCATHDYTFEEYTDDDSHVSCDANPLLAEDIEINNIANDTNNAEINNYTEEVMKYVPKVKEIVIKSPVAEGKKRLKPIEEVKQGGEFTF